MSERTIHSPETIPDGSPTVAFDINLGRRIPVGKSIEVDYGKLNQVASQKLYPEEVDNLTIEVKDIPKRVLGERAIALPLDNLDYAYPYALSQYADKLRNNKVHDQTVLGQLGMVADGLVTHPIDTANAYPIHSMLLVSNPILFATIVFAGQTQSEARAKRFAMSHGKQGAFSVPRLSRYSGRRRNN